MTDQEKPANPPVPNPQENRRNRANNLEAPEVKFAQKNMPADKLDALKKFLKNASPDDIKVVRDCYGDNPEVLKLIGLEPIDEEKDLDKNDYID